MKPGSRRLRLERLAENLAQRTFGIETWIPRHDRLVGAPPLLPGEALSSWFFRIQVHFGVSAPALRQALGLTSPLHWLDVGGDGLALEPISSMVMQSAESLRALVWPAFTTDCLYVLACLTTLPLERQPLVRYCEHCLQEDSDPYFRQLWRFTFAYCCPLHGSVLRDHCPHCKVPLGTSYFRPNIRRGSLRNCSHCMGDLAAVKSTMLPPDMLYQLIGTQLELGNLVKPEAEFVKSAIGQTKDGNFDFVRCNGVIDVASEVNVRKLYGSMISMTLSPPAVGGLRSRFSPYLMRRDIGSHRAVALGLDGWSIFGNKAGTLPLSLSRAQLLTGGTFWWSTHHQEEIFELMPACSEEVLADAVTWIQSLLTTTNRRQM